MTTGSFFKSIEGMRDAERLYHRHASWALSVAITAHLMMVTVYYFYGILMPAPPVKTSGGGRPDTVWVIPGDPTTPKIPSGTSIKSGISTRQITHATFGLPIPSMEPFEDSLQDSNFGPIEPGNGGREEGGTNPDDEGTFGKLPDETEPSPDDVRFVQVEPIPVRAAMPGYPELARRLGVEGTVWVKILIDKEGRPRKTIVVKSENSLLDDSARTAAMRWLFTPAMMTRGPVMVWAAVPFRFRLSR